MVQLTVSAASKPVSLARGLPLTIEVTPETTVADVKRAIAEKYPRFKPSRQRITLKGERKPLETETKLSDVLDAGAKTWELDVKDLGAQISWRTVFIVEYLGPLLIHPVFYHFPKIFYGVDVQHSALQKWVLLFSFLQASGWFAEYRQGDRRRDTWMSAYVYAFTMLHFLKRELETLYVHRFSHDTMPWVNIFRNSGVLFAADIYRPAFSATSPAIVNSIRSNEHFLWACTGLWAFAEISNLHTHLTVRSLRPPGTRRRAIPYGYGFNLVSFPNYFFEIVGWVVISVMTRSIGVSIFTAVATCTMGLWAAKKHRNYKKEFGKEYPRNRKAMIPFIF
ncbi:hypothetical protein D9613_008091 [Agrocybe pediades]|uniref:very-long-chain enoyl-CoA reductase n=1 Tax=Agrocybe pediades TaxID=84607 RepID=A0A8H4VLC8_9AGAR|nr:hypothetical protein D9613_008091 [Agrocybe pediades]